MTVGGVSLAPNVAESSFRATTSAELSTSPFWLKPPKRLGDYGLATGGFRSSIKNI